MVDSNATIKRPYGFGFKSSVWFLFTIACISLFASLIANDKPLYVKTGSQMFFPAISNETYYDQDLKFSDLASIHSDTLCVIMPFIRYAPGASDIQNSDFKSPSQTQFKDEQGNRKMLAGLERHLLGTGKRGEDLSSGLIHGTRISLSVGIYASLIAGFIGILLGALAGYFGDHGFRLTRGMALSTTMGIFPAWFYASKVIPYLFAFESPESAGSSVLQMIASLGIFALVISVCSLLGRCTGLVPFLKKEIDIPVDWFVSRSIEIVNSLPKLIIIISLAAISRPGLSNVILLIGLTYWTDIARITRAEIMRIRNADYIASAKSTGATSLRILYKQALPNALPVLSVAMVACMASAILTESSLSFLGLGVPVDLVTWGTLLAGAREQFNAWWLVVFPGMMVFFTILSLNKIADTISSAHRAS